MCAFVWTCHLLPTVDDIISGTLERSHIQGFRLLLGAAGPIDSPVQALGCFCRALGYGCQPSIPLLVHFHRILLSHTMCCDFRAEGWGKQNYLHMARFEPTSFGTSRVRGYLRDHRATWAVVYVSAVATNRCSVPVISFFFLTAEL